MLRRYQLYYRIKKISFLLILWGIFYSHNLHSQSPITRFEHITSDDGLAQNTVLGIVKDKYGFMWFGTWNGLCRYDGYSYKTYMYNPKDRKSINNNRIHTLKLDKDKNLWVRTFENDELCRYNYERDNFDRLSRGSIPDTLFLWTDRRKHVQSAGISYKDYTWNIKVPTNRLVEKNIKSGSTKIYQEGSNNPGQLNDAYVTDIYKDNHNILWIGTYSNGINKANLAAKPFGHVYNDPSISNSLRDNNVTAICQDLAGNVWVGTRDKGITVIGKNARHITKGAGSISSDLIRAIFCDSRGIIWIGTKEGLNTYNTLTGKFKDFSASVNYTTVFGITEDNEHNLLFASWNGLYKYNFSKDKFISYNPDKMQLHAHTRVVMQDSKGRVWVGCEGAGGTTGGISVLEPQKGTDTYKLIYHFIHDEYKNSISDNRINCIYEDKEGIFWIGTGNGLDRYDPVNKKFSNLSTNGKFPKSSVVSILEDSDGYLWIGHKKGITQLNKNKLSIRTYSLQDGLQSNEFNGGASYKSKISNNLYFGGNNGYNVFNPGNIRPEITLPNTILTRLEILNRNVGINEEVNGRIVLNKPLYLTKEIELNYSDKSISIEFSGLHYSNPAANKYAYKLEGFDKDWVFTNADRRVATYSNLGSGSYLFKVISSNSDGVWNKEPTVLKIKVLPPFWASTWAYIVYVILLLIILYVYHSYSTRITRLKSKLAYEALMHKQEFELHQSKLQFFTNISHEIKTPLTLILAPLERLLHLFTGNDAVYSQLSTMKGSGDRLLKLVNQLLDFRKLETGNLQLNLEKHDIIAFLNRTIKSFKDAAEDRDIKISFECDVDRCVFLFDEDKLEKVIYNLLSNALKFTPGSGWIKLQLSFTNKDAGTIAVIKVINLSEDVISADDQSIIFLPFRQGAAHKAGGTGLGLAYTKGLVELHGGTITVKSLVIHKEVHTSFIMELPLKPVVNTTIIQRDSIPQEKADLTPLLQCDIASLDTKIKPNVTGTATVILLVEDNAEMRNYLKVYFSDKYTVLEASNGIEGFEVAVNHLPDLIISDVMMDGMDGFEFCKKVKTESKTSHIPVILLTAKTPLEAEIQGIETGADDYITKPFNLALLSARVTNLLILRSTLKDKYRKEISLKPNEDVPLSADEKLLKKLLAFVEDNMANAELGVEEICNGVGVSRSQLYRKVKELTGLSLLEILKEIRFKRARQLFASGKVTVNEVAYMVGFSDVDYFRKCFKAEFGMTPTEYTKENTVQ